MECFKQGKQQDLRANRQEEVSEGRESSEKAPESLMMWLGLRVGEGWGATRAGDKQTDLRSIQGPSRVSDD